MHGSILIVDDDARVRTALARALAETVPDVRTADSGEQALARIAERSPDVLLTDVRMPGMDGLELLRLLRERAPEVDVVLMTAHDDLPVVARAMRHGARDFLVKPLDLDHLLQLLERIGADRALRSRTAASAAAPLKQLVGRDPGIVEIFKVVGQAAATDATVLIRGESGTGKELIARAIHHESARAGQPFVAVNCTALPATLLESELFGHVRGAFTGAAGDRRGRFSLAGRGTILLDEIGDTSPDFQTKLLRVLQEHEFHPVGAERAERTEARVIAATHRDLERLVADGSFREDLYYRLRVVEIVVPPLRERRSDIPALAAHLVAVASQSLGRRPPVLCREAIDELLAHNWPGNVRELENAMTRAVVLATGDVIRPQHLSLTLRAQAADAPRLASLDQVEREHVAQVLAATRGHKTRTARILGVSRPRLDRLLRKHGLSAEEPTSPGGA